MLNDQSNLFKSNFNTYSDYESANQSEVTADFELIVNNLNILFTEKYNRSLNTVEELLLKAVWQQKTYSEIAKENNYSPNYFSNVVAPKLFKQLSMLVERDVTKKTCRSIVTKYVIRNAVKRESRTHSSRSHSNKYSFRAEDNWLNSAFLQDAISLAQFASIPSLSKDETTVEKVADYQVDQITDAKGTCTKAHAEKEMKINSLSEAAQVSLARHYKAKHHQQQSAKVISENFTRFVIINFWSSLSSIEQQSVNLPEFKTCMSNFHRIIQPSILFWIVIAWLNTFANCSIELEL